MKRKLVPRGAFAVTAVERDPTLKRLWVSDARLTAGTTSGTTVTSWITAPDCVLSSRTNRATW